MDVTGIILAGGKSRRFGPDKGSALLAGLPLIEWVRRGLEPYCRRIVVVTAAGREHRGTDLETWHDLEEGKGVLGGIASGLESAETPWVLASGCDLPFLQPGIVDLLLEGAEGSDLVVPRTSRGFEPLRALYAKGCLPVMRRKIAAGELKVDGFFGEVGTRPIPEDAIRRIDPGLVSFFNVNSREDLARAEDLLREGKAPVPPGPMPS